MQNTTERIFELCNAIADEKDAANIPKLAAELRALGRAREHNIPSLLMELASENLMVGAWYVQDNGVYVAWHVIPREIFAG